MLELEPITQGEPGKLSRSGLTVASRQYASGSLRGFGIQNASTLKLPGLVNKMQNAYFTFKFQLCNEIFSSCMSQAVLGAFVH